MMRARIHHFKLKASRGATIRFAIVALLASAIFHVPAREADAQWFSIARPSRAFERCVDLVDRKQFDEARVCIRNFMTDYPNSRWVERLQFLEAKLETNVYEARIKMRAFLQEFPEGPYSAKANYSLAQLYELDGDYAEAGKFYLKIHDHFPKSELKDESMLQAARCMLLSAEAEAAHLRLEAYLAGEPDQPWRGRAEKLYADALFEAGELRAAQTKYREIISTSSAPEDVSPEYYIKIAGVYDGEGAHKAALQAYRRFLQIFPTAVQRPAVERKVADLALTLKVDLSLGDRPHIIEAGLYESRQEAMRLVGRLTRLGHRAYLVTRSVDKSHLVSVRLGPYASRDSALAVAERLYDEAGLKVTLLPQGG